MNNSEILKVYKEVSKFIPEEDIYLNEPMSRHTTFKIGGNADIFVKIRNIDELKNVIKLTSKIEQPLHIVGNGSNILVRDNGIRGIVAKICIDAYKFINEDTIRVDAGMLNAKLAKILLEKGLSGFEFAAGIPGTVGGAIKMNAGAYGGQMSDVVVSTRYIDLTDENLEIKEINNKEHEFSYRHSVFFDKNAII